VLAYCQFRPSHRAWNSLDKGESQAKIGYFFKAIFFLFAKTTQLIVEWGSYLASQ